MKKECINFLSLEMLPGYGYLRLCAALFLKSLELEGPDPPAPRKLFLCIWDFHLDWTEESPPAHGYDILESHSTWGAWNSHPPEPG